jgi:hypothetical protein
MITTTTKKKETETGNVLLTSFSWIPATMTELRLKDVFLMKSFYLVILILFLKFCTGFFSGECAKCQEEFSRRRRETREEQRSEMEEAEVKIKYQTFGWCPPSP